MRMKLHVPATSCLSKGAQMSKSEKLSFVVGSPWHEKLTKTHPSRSVDTGVGVGVGSSADLGAASVDVGTGVGADAAGVGTGAGVVSCPDPPSDISAGSGVDTGEGLDAVVVAVICPKT